MSDERQAFEQLHAIPSGAEWCEKRHIYIHKKYSGLVLHPINESWEAFCEGALWQASRQALEGEAAAKKAEDERQQEADQQALKQKQAEQNKRLAAEAEMAKAEMASREQYDEGQKAVKQPAPVAAKAAQSTPVNKGAHPERPSTAEIISVLASHYGVDTGVVALWIHELKVQEAA